MRRVIIECRVPPCAIVKAHDVAESCQASAVMRRENMICTLALECRPETLHRRIIQTTAGAAHADDEAVIVQFLLVRLTSI
jgi:hypothetical protein